MDASLPEPGQTFAGRYTIRDLLGRGGMAVVYRAHDQHHDRDVALKVLPPALGAALGEERFLREIATTARLTHPNLVPLFDSGVDHGLSWYVMPLLPGPTLRDRLDSGGPLPLDEALRLFADVSSALDYAHGQGVLHRDLKPGNILLQGDRAAVADFGIALPIGAPDQRLTETGISVGTPAYMSPEQAVGDRTIDARSDEYALACVLYEMLAGEPPFTGPTPTAVLAKRMRDPVPLLGTRRKVPRGIEAAVTRALARDPAERFPTVRAFADAVVAARLDPGAVPAGSKSRVRMRWLVGLTAVLVAAGFLLVRSRLASRATSLDPHLVVVLPFRVAAPGANLASWEEGMVDLLGAKLTGQGGPRAADPRATLASYRSLAAHGAAADLPERLADLLGAGLVLDGSIVGGANRIVLSARLTSMPGNHRGADVSVEGPPDSLLALVDRMAIQLLGREAGEPGRSLAAETTLATWEAYLEGRAAWRHGQAEPAIKAFREALATDSTFALAGLELLRVLWRQGDDDSNAVHVVSANLHRLGPADSLWARAILGPHYPAPDNARDRLRTLEQLVSRFPDQADAWFELGDAQFHEGSRIDLDSVDRVAERSLSRAVALDSNVVALDHLFFIAIERPDTMALHALLARGDSRDTLGPMASFLRWRIGIARGDSAVVHRVRASMASLSYLSLSTIIQFPQLDGIAIDDAALAVAALRARAVTPIDRSRARDSQTLLALNRGRPREVAPDSRPRVAMADVLWAEADSAAGIAAARSVAATMGRPPATDAEWRDRLMLGFWQLTRHDVAAARVTAAQLRPARPRHELWNRDTADDTIVGRRLLDAWVAIEERRSSAVTQVRQLDSLAATGPATSLGKEMSLIVARLFERLDDPERARRALQRIPWFGRDPGGRDEEYRSTILLARARDAAKSGHPAEAAHDYEIYLALRHAPDPQLVPERDSARAELARLTRK